MDSITFEQYNSNYESANDIMDWYDFFNPGIP